MTTPSVARAVDVGGRLEQHVDRRADAACRAAAGRDARRRGRRRGGTTGAGRPARADTVPGTTHVAFGRFLDRQRRQLVELAAHTSRCSRPACACTIAIGTGKSAGSRGMTSLSPCGPPVEMPITTMSTGRRRRAARAVRRGGASARAGAIRAASARRGRLDLFDQLLGHVEQPLARQRRRLLQEVDRAGIERGQHLLAGAVGDAHDDDRDRAPRHLLPHERARRPSPACSGRR